MKIRDAHSLIEPAVGRSAGVWADIGAGSGTFTRALAELLGEDSTVFAIDRDSGALTELSSHEVKNVVPVVADFTQPFAFASPRRKFDGMLLANALHFVPEASLVLSRLVELMKPGGRVVLVEYDQRGANRWVPYPIPVSALPALARQAALSEFMVVATRPSMYQGTLYCAVASRSH